MGGKNSHSSLKIYKQDWPHGQSNGDIVCELELASSATSCTLGLPQDFTVKLLPSPDWVGTDESVCLLGMRTKGNFKRTLILKGNFASVVLVQLVTLHGWWLFGENDFIFGAREPPVMEKQLCAGVGKA